MLNESSNMNTAIFVQKRDGTQQEVSFDKVLKRTKSLSYDLNVNPHLIAQKLCNRIYDGVKTSELDILGGEICALMITTHPDYQILAGRIAMSNLEKNTSPSFSETIQILYDNIDKIGKIIIPTNINSIDNKLKSVITNLRMVDDSIEQKIDLYNINLNN